MIPVISWIVGLYIGFGKVFAGSIISACTAFDAGTLSGSMIAWTVFKCILSPTIATIITLAVAFVLTIIVEFIKQVIE